LVATAQESAKTAPLPAPYEQGPFPPPWVQVRTHDDYLLTRRLGTGKFSDVFEAVDVNKVENRQEISDNSVDPRTLSVLKCLKPVSERKIRREVWVLGRVRHVPNVVRLEAIVMGVHEEDGTEIPVPPMPTLVLQHAGQNAQWLCHSPANVQQRKQADQRFLTDYEIRYYVMHLLVALDGLHSADIMHRDVKPRNVIINRNRQSGDPPLVLIDLGLADRYVPGQSYHCRVASRHYKATELLTGHGFYGPTLDMWGVGCILASLLLHREPFFRGKDNTDQLGKIIAVLGTNDLLAYIQKYNIQPSQEVQEEILKYHQVEHYRQRRKFVSRDSAAPADGLDLLDKLLVYDHKLRWDAAQAMQHSYFDPVRERVLREVQEAAKQK
jgi:casein kinase II subunit alpha